MNETLIGLHSEPTGVVVVIANGYGNEIDTIASDLRSLGLKNTEVLSGVGAIIGTVADERSIAKMADVDGVKKITKSRIGRRKEWSPRG